MSDGNNDGNNNSNIVGLDGGKKNEKQPEREVQVAFQYGVGENPQVTTFRGPEVGFHFTGMENYVVIASGDPGEGTDDLIAIFPTHVVYWVRDTTPSQVKVSGA